MDAGGAEARSGSVLQVGLGPLQPGGDWSPLALRSVLGQVCLARQVGGPFLFPNGLPGIARHLRVVS
eukprot:5537972-Alexandrium_andersonii.AAC.1